MPEIRFGAVEGLDKMRSDLKSYLMVGTSLTKTLNAISSLKKYVLLLEK